MCKRIIIKSDLLSRVQMILYLHSIHIKRISDELWNSNLNMRTLAISYLDPGIQE